MNVLDLFSGIGGFSIGLERAGMKTIAFCEIEEFPRKVLKKHWPDVPIFEDVRKLHAENIPGTVDVICGGYPCQPFSLAGKRKGKEDDRHLWPEMFRLVRECRPSWVIAENVAGHVSMGLDQVLSDLESEDYTCWTFIIPACSVGAPHRRDRVWVIANSSSAETYTKFQKCGRSNKQKGQSPESWGEAIQVRKTDTDMPCGSCETMAISTDSNGKRRGQCRRAQGKNINVEQSSQDATNSNSKGLQKRHEQGVVGKAKETFSRCEPTGRNYEEDWNKWPSESPVCSRDDGVPNRVARLRALGNSVVPQIPEIIGRAIMEIENTRLVER